MSPYEPVWLEKAALIALHDRTLALHGGPVGLRDEGLLDSALKRPIHRRVYDNEASLAVLAATYAVGVASNHPFVDGNKRAAYQAMILFLALNGAPLEPDAVDAIRTMQAVAAGEIDIESLADWIRANSAAT
ncbi:type II toxin-antitoxin system death-on-curing family toxin [uncultured Brevundimonas sp.]|uniref:type II toxin-antitoxin system death-on-curing family toxin n=1 Tax=uncultured Brevundimonas sp. TaxID=213418 RepID=UPI0030EB1D64|tara:strand:+ start:152166 stop:152561 length:396 start_codon:yes stop_codon:yes gene_type:complete